MACASSNTGRAPAHTESKLPQSVPTASDQHRRAPRRDRLQFSLPSLRACASASSHDVIFRPGCASCSVCHQGVSGPSSLVRQWMRTDCVGPPKGVHVANAVGEIDNLPDRPMPVSASSCVYIAGQSVHPAHRLHALNRLFFRTRCGRVAAERVRGLAKPCLGQRPDGEPRDAYGRRNLAALRRGLLPPGVKQWPVADLSTV